MGIERLTGARQGHDPDVLECLANLSSDEVFTPPSIANAMLDQLPEDVWSNPELRWLDPCCKSGVFLREAARRLMSGLAVAIPDENARREHIFKRMLFGIAITQLTGQISRRTLYYSKNATHDGAVVHFDHPDGRIIVPATKHTFKGGHCIVCGAPEELQLAPGRDGMENYAYGFLHAHDLFEMKFDVIIGNPPYQLSVGGDGAGATPIYQLFVEKAIAMDARFVSFIIPSRWFAGGMGLNEFRRRMLSDRSLKVLVDYRDASEAFPGVEIKGGVCYFLRDREHDGDCEVRTFTGGKISSTAVRNLGAEGDVLIRSNEAIAILQKVRARKEQTLDSRVSPIRPFGLETQFRGSAQKGAKNSVLLFQRNGTAWVSMAQVGRNTDWVSQEKVLISQAYGAGESIPHQIIGRPFIAGPGTACTATYLVAGVFSSNVEAENYRAYLCTRFVRFLVSLRKISQHTKANCFAFVPDLDFNQKWDDEALYKRYSLSEAEVRHIEAMIKEM